jgi:glycosyltransferase involved in cell wall biosynthesis
MIEVIPDGTDTEVFFPRDKLEARRFLGWKSEEKVVFFYEGNRPGPKGRETVDAVMEELEKDSSDFRLHVVQMGLSQNLLSMMLSASDCMIFASLSEGSPNIVREAISCGCPVVTVRVGDVEMWISDSTIGKVVNRDPVQLSESVKEVIEKSAKSKALTQIPDLAQTASRINLVYESIVG